METVEFDRDGNVGWVRLNRPAVHNAMNGRLWGELAELGAELRDDPSIRALVVTGNGRSFSSGIDLTDLTELGGGAFASAPGAGTPPEPDPLVAWIEGIQDAYRWIPEAPYPVLAAVRGHALGGGLQLALACDLRVVARGAKLGLPEHRYGLVPDLGGTYFLARLVGPSKAKELIWAGAVIDAEESHRIGLADHLVDDADLESEAAALAARLAAAPPLPVAAAKRMIDAGAHQSFSEHLAAVAREQARCVRSADFVEAVSAAVGKRSPLYEGR